MWGPQLNLKTCIWITHYFNKSQQSITVQGKIMESVCNIIRTCTYSNIYGPAERPPSSHTTMRCTSTKSAMPYNSTTTSKPFTIIGLPHNVHECSNLHHHLDIHSTATQQTCSGTHHNTNQSINQTKPGELKPSMKMTKLESFTVKHPPQTKLKPNLLNLVAKTHKTQHKKRLN